jgi:hypothetical protein
MQRLRTGLFLSITGITATVLTIFFPFPGSFIIHFLTGIALGLTAAAWLTNKTIQRFKVKTDNLSKGILPETDLKGLTDEWVGLENSIGRYVDVLKTRINFSGELAAGNLDATTELTSDQDILGKTLINIRDNLVKVRSEEDRRNWATAGLASLGEILRLQTTSVKEFGDRILPAVIKYINANQGNLYVTNEEEQVLELISSYAWNRKKYLTDKIPFGEGLAGQCLLEKEMIFLTDIPDEYFRITSGTGGSNPRCIVIIPLIHNHTVRGILELATFRMLEDYQLDFLNKLCEAIASSMQNITGNENTRNLLKQSQLLTEEMRAQEEELRQNMEELQATQDEIVRKDYETQKKLKEVEHNYELQLKEIARQKEELNIQKNLLYKALREDSLLIDITGRNRYLSQKMGFLCEMICNGKDQHKSEVRRIVTIHDQSLNAIRYGGTPPDMPRKIVFPPAPADIIENIIEVDELWQVYKKNIGIITDTETKTDNTDSNIKGLKPEIFDALQVIEEIGGEMLRRNNELVQACIRMNEKSLAGVKVEMEEA